MITAREGITKNKLTVDDEDDEDDEDKDGAF